MTSRAQHGSAANGRNSRVFLLVAVIVVSYFGFAWLGYAERWHPSDRVEKRGRFGVGRRPRSASHARGAHVLLAVGVEGDVPKEPLAVSEPPRGTETVLVVEEDPAAGDKGAPGSGRGMSCNATYPCALVSALCGGDGHSAPLMT